MLWGLFLLISVILIATYLLLPTPNQDIPKSANLNDFNFPDNSKHRAVPILFGSVWMHGNVIEYGNLKTLPIKICQ